MTARPPASAGAAGTGGSPSAPRVSVVVVLFLVASTVASVLLVGLQDATRLDPDVVVLTQLATAVGALVTWLVWRGRLPYPAVRVVGWRQPLLTSLAVAAVLALVLVLAELVGGERWSVLDTDPLGAPLVVVMAAQVVGAAGEEVGWRGLVQPVLETRMRLLPAALTTGLLFGVGHVVVLAAGVAVYALFVVSAVGLSLALAVVTAGRSAGQRVALATTLHWLVNMVVLVGFDGGAESVRWMATLAAGMWVAALAALALSRPRRSGQLRRG